MLWGARLAESRGEGWQQGLDICITHLAPEQLDRGMLKIRHEPQDVTRPRRLLGPGFGFAPRQQKPGENQRDLKLGAFSGRFWASDVSSSQFPANSPYCWSRLWRGSKACSELSFLFPTHGKGVFLLPEHLGYPAVLGDPAHLEDPARRQGQS